MASTLISVPEMRSHVESDLDDKALERLVDAADAEVIRAAGPHDGEQTVTLLHQTGSLVWLPRPATSIKLLKEAQDEQAIVTVAELLPHTYMFTVGGRAIRRINGYWLPIVQVTYTPVPDNSRRVQALIDLVKLEVQYSGLSSEGVGTYRGQGGPAWWNSEKQRILRGLRQNYAGAGLLA